MIDKITHALEKYEMLSFTEKVTVALSGGADSVCLLSVLSQLKKKYGYRLYAVHINHMLRGEESDRDEAFTVALCEKFSVPLTVRRIDIKALAKQQGGSIELVARNARYEVFREVGDGGVVATAHTADDNLETVLYNTVRGSGLRGICGIPPKRDIYIRPLIFCSRKEIEEYLAKSGLEFVVDSSNKSDDYTRNFLRHNAVPLLRQINPKAEQTVAAMCATLREDEEFLFSTAKKIYVLCLREKLLDAELLRLQPSAIIKRVIALYLWEEANLKIDSLHLENCKKILISGGKTGLSDGVSAVCEGERFFLVKGKEKVPTTKYETQTIRKTLSKGEKVNNLFLKNTIDYDKINGSLVVRTRLASDEIRLKGRNCTKSLKKLFNELKIPTELRDVIPVAADDIGVVWIYGIGVSERVAVDQNTTETIEFAVHVNQ